MSETLRDALIAWAREEEAIGSWDNKSNANLLRRAAAEVDRVGVLGEFISRVLPEGTGGGTKEQHIAKLIEERNSLRAEVDRLRAENEKLREAAKEVTQKSSFAMDAPWRAMDRLRKVLADCEPADPESGSKR